eukprot:1171357-Pyramimonas_sp.AAC.1
MRCTCGAVVFSSCSVAAALRAQKVPGGTAGCAPLPPVLGHARAELGAGGRASVDGMADASDADSSR